MKAERASAEIRTIRVLSGAGVSVRGGICGGGSASVGGYRPLQPGDREYGVVVLHGRLPVREGGDGRGELVIQGVPGF